MKGFRLQDETARIEDQLTKTDSLEALIRCFVNAKSNSFENLLEPYLKMCRLSNAITIGLAKSQFFKRIIDKLNHSKAVVRLNLLRLLRTVCEAHPNRAMLVERYGIYDIVVKLSKEDGAVLVRELAREIVPSLAPALKPLSGRPGRHGEGPKTPKSALAPKKMRRAASESIPVTSSELPPLRNDSNLRPATRRGPTTRSSRQRLNDISWQLPAERQ